MCVTDASSRPRSGALWQIGLSAVWFAISYKWFILLLALLPGQVAEIVPEGEKNRYWGFVFMVGAVWALFGPALFGGISDRMNRKRGLFIGLSALLTLGALATLYHAPSILMLALGYLMLQVSDDIGQGPSSALIPELVEEARRGQASAMLSLLQFLGQVGSAVAGLVLGRPDLIYLGIGVVTVVCASATLLSLRGVSPIEANTPPPPDIGFWAGWLQPWKNRDFRLVWFVRFLTALGFYLVQPYLRNFLEDSFDTYQILWITLPDSGMAAVALALTVSVSAALSSIAAGALADAWGRKRTATLSGVLMFCALVPFALVGHYSSIWALSIPFGVGYGLYITSTWAMASDVMPDRRSVGRDMGLWQSSVTSVQIVAGSSGILIDILNRAHHGFGYRFFIVVAAVLMLASTMLVRRVRGSS